MQAFLSELFILTVKVEKIKRNLCQLEELGLSCIGCCGFDFTNKKEVMEALDRNSDEFKDFYDNESIDLKGFRDRHPKDILRISGICYNLIWEDKERGLIFCPLHPMVIEGQNTGQKDLREGHCNPGHLCRIAYKFMKWSRDKQDRYVAFLKSNNLDWYEYSIKNDDGSLLDEFEQHEL